MSSLSQAREISLDYLGQQIIPHAYIFQNTLVGGLSSIDYDRATDRYAAVSDDRSNKNPARFYGLRLDYDIAGFKSWKMTSVDFMKQRDGTVFPKPGFLDNGIVDPEALRFSPNGKTYLWASEGNAKEGINPFIREMARDGTYIRDFTVPEEFKVGPEKGIRDNLAFEGLTLDMDKTSFLVSTEGPLIQDGAEATVTHSADVRLVQMDLKSGQPIHEYVYSVEPIQKEALPIGNFSINGVVDLLAIGPQKYIVVERSFSMGVGLSVRLYIMDTHEATDVLKVKSLKGAHYKRATKKLLLDLGSLGIAIDNIEGITFGKRLQDGRSSLVLISDDNFSSLQVTQILAFAVSGLE